MGKTEYDRVACAKKFNRLVDIYEEIITSGGKTTILTGSNGSGKSFIRKQLYFRIKEETKNKSTLVHTSMDLRSSSNPSMGALSGMARDLSWLATSFNTKHSIESTIKQAVGNFYCIDEPELGFGEEGQLAMAQLLNAKIREIKEQCLGFLIITHSRIMVQNLDCDLFINIEGMTKNEWLTREIKPLDLDELEKNELFFYIRDYGKD